jgi:molybdate transport system substrate-binding protein
VPGVDLAGPLPADLQQYTGFSAAASPKAAHDQHAAALIAFLRSPAAAPVYRAKGMQVTQ